MKINIISAYEVSIPDEWDYNQICAYVDQNFNFLKEYRTELSWTESSENPRREFFNV